jgi:hypothetical protein
MQTPLTHPLTKRALLHLDAVPLIVSEREEIERFAATTKDRRRLAVELIACAVQLARTKGPRHVEQTTWLLELAYIAIGDAQQFQSLMEVADPAARELMEKNALENSGARLPTPKPLPGIGLKRPSKKT